MDYQQAREELILKGVSREVIRFFDTVAIHSGLRPGLSQREMFDRSFERPSNFYELPEEEQWALDKRLGILDWYAGSELTPDDVKRYRSHYDRWNAKKPPTSG